MASFSKLWLHLLLVYGSRKVAKVRGHLKSLTTFSMTISSSEDSSSACPFAWVEGCERSEGNHVDSLGSCTLPSGWRESWTTRLKLL